MPEAKFRIESGANPERLKVAVEDRTSGTTIASFNLDPEQIWQLVRGGSFEVDGLITGNFDRLGKTMVHETYLMPKELHKDTYGPGLEDLAEDWAREAYPGWDNYSGHRTNTGGVRVIVRKWVDQ